MAEVRRFGSVLSAEFTSGVTAVGGIVGVLSMVLSSYFSELTFVDAGGGNTLNIPLSFCFLLGPLLGGIAALRVGRLQAQGALDVAASTPRRRTGVLLITGVSLVIWGALAYGCAALIVGLAIGLNGPWVADMTLLPVLAVALLTACIVIGMAVGARLSHVLAGPSLTLVGLIGLNALDIAPSPVGKFSPIFADKFYHYGTQPNGPLVVSVLGCVCGLSIAVFAVGADLSARSALVAAALALLMMLGGATGVLRASDDALVARRGDAGLCRTRSGVTLCVWPGPGVRVDSALDGLVRVRDVASRFMSVPRYFHEAGLTAPDDAREMVVNSPKAAPGSGIGNAEQAVLPQACDARTLLARDELLGLLTESVSPGTTNPAPPFAEGITVSKRPLADQRAWTATRLHTLSACD